MEDITLSKELLQQLLTEAYKAGWEGTLEGKSQAVNSILNRHVSKKKKIILDTTNNPVSFNFEPIIVYH